MAANFKCCKNKVQPNWICLQCKNVFHKKCRERIKEPVIVVKDNLIWCSRQCCEMSTETDPGIIDSLKQTIDDLSSELELKTRYIERLKGEMSSFVEEASSSEEQLISENQDLKSTVAGLEGRLREHEGARVQLEQENQDHLSVIESQWESEIKKQRACILSHEKTVASLERGNLRLESDLNDCRLKIRDLIAEVKNLNDIGDGMLVTIETLTNENNWLSDELEGLKQQLSTSSELQRAATSFNDIRNDTLLEELAPATDAGGSSMQPIPHSLLEELAAAIDIDESSVHVNPLTLRRDNFSHSSRPGSPPGCCAHGSRNRVVVCGDESARGISAGIRKYLDVSKTDILGYVKSGCSMERLSTEVFGYTKTLGHRDTAIICLRFNSLQSLDIRSVNKMCAVGKYCNLIFNISYSRSKYSNVLFDRLVTLVSEFLRNNSASVRIFSNDFEGHKFRLTRNALYRYLAHYISCNDAVKNHITLKNVFVDDGITNLTNHFTVDDGLLSSDANQSEAFLA